MRTIKRLVLAAVLAVTVTGAAVIAAPTEEAEAGSWGGCAVETYRERGWLLLSPVAFSFAWQHCWAN